MHKHANFKILLIGLLLCCMANLAAAPVPISTMIQSHGAIMMPDLRLYDNHGDSRGPRILSHTVAVGANLTAMPFLYDHMTGLWGDPNGSFHFKDDWNGDNLGLNDEVSHLFVSYKLAQFLVAGYGKLGYSEKTARILGFAEAAFIVTAVEFPIDAFNPDQGLGVSDLIFDYTGLGLAYLKLTDSRFEDFDLKVSVKSLSYDSRSVLGDNSEDYDNYIYWLTYRKTPFVFGLGYGTDHPEVWDVDRQFHLGIGTTLPDLLGLFSEDASKFFRWAELYYINIRWNFVTID